MEKLLSELETWQAVIVGTVIFGAVIAMVWWANEAGRERQRGRRGGR